MKLKKIFISLCVIISLIGMYSLGRYRGENTIFFKHTTKEMNGVYSWMLAKSEMPENTLKEIYKETTKYDNADLLLAIISVESDFNPFVKSSKQARGLMGVTPKWWMEELKNKNIVKSQREIFEIKKNIEVGNYILSQYFALYKNIDNVLNKYSGGAKGYSQKVFVALGEINYARIKGRW